MNINIHTDGGARGNPGPAASAFEAEESGKVLAEVSEYIGISTNNQAEYKALLMALTWAVENYNDTSITLYIHMDSELIVKQVRGEYKVKDEKLKKFFDKVIETKKYFKGKINISHVPRSENKKADFLVNKELDSQ